MNWSIMQLLVCLSLVLLCTSGYKASAQDQKNQAFWDDFDEARLSIAKHNAGRSIQILEELLNKDSLDPNVGFLLGVSLIVVGKEANRAAELFEMADKNFSHLWDNPGVGPPEHLFYYMIFC